LQPGTPYRYRLRAINENAEKTESYERVGVEGEFTTGAAPAPSVSTGGSSAVTATSALISGTVDPDGLPASYAFELGVYNGANTQYGVVFSGSAGASLTAEERTLALSGLQPGTTYAYRVTISSGYIVNETHTIQGATATFTTAGVPAVLVSPSALAQLSVPSIVFPQAVKVSVRKAVKHPTKRHVKARARKRKPRKGKK
jgi:hypothetical protein